MADDWNSGLVISEQLAKNCIVTQFPDLKISKIIFLGQGWDNTVYLINDNIVFRFPRHVEANDLLKQENHILLNLATQVDLAIPQPKYLGHDHQLYPFSFQGYDLIVGAPGYQTELTANERQASLPVIARFLKQLHNISIEQARDMGVKPNPEPRTNKNKLIKTFATRLKKIIDRNLCQLNQKNLQNEIDKIAELKLPPIDLCLAHGDIDCRHVIFNHKKLVGLIDWGDVSLDTRAADLDFIWGFYPAHEHEQFFQIYGHVEPSLWQYARFIALYTYFTHYLYGSDINDKLLVKEAADSIMRINPDLIA